MSSWCGSFRNIVKRPCQGAEPDQNEPGLAAQSGCGTTGALGPRALGTLIESTRTVQHALDGDTVRLAKGKNLATVVTFDA